MSQITKLSQERVRECVVSLVCYYFRSADFRHNENVQENKKWGQAWADAFSLKGIICGGLKDPTTSYSSYTVLAAPARILTFQLFIINYPKEVWWFLQLMGDPSPNSNCQYCMSSCASLFLNNPRNSNTCLWTSVRRCPGYRGPVSGARSLVTGHG